MDKLYFIGRWEFKSFAEPLAKYLNLELVHKDHWQDSKCCIGYYDYLYPYFLPPIEMKDKCQLITTENVKAVTSWDNKIKQKDKLKGKILIPDYYTLPKLDSLMSMSSSINKKVCITQTTGGRGGKKTVVFDPEKHGAKYLSRRTNMFSIIDPIIVSDFVNKEKDVVINIIVFDDGYIYVSEPIGQFTGDEHLFEGLEYPIELSDHIKGNIKSYGEIIGKEMYKDGYRGVAGIDLMIQGDSVYFVEINPRKAISSFGINHLLQIEYGLSMSILDYKTYFEEGHPEFIKKDDYQHRWEIIHNYNWNMTDIPQYEFKEYK